MIKKMEIKNFKCFANSQVEFKPFTIFVGGNGAGKSSIIQSLLLNKSAIEQMQKYNDKNVEVLLNGPYMLSLGQVDDIISSNAEGEDIVFTLESEGETVKIVYKLNEHYETHILSGHMQVGEINTHIISDKFSYLLAERLGPRKTLEKGMNRKLNVGHKGEFVSYVIQRSDAEKKQVDEKLVKNNDTIKFSTQVQEWLNYIVPNFEFQYQDLNELGAVSLKYKNITYDTEFYHANSTGFGISYVLPIIVQALEMSSQQNSMLIIENPEAHLHPLSQSRIGKFLADVSRCGVQIIVETHSEHIINGARIQMAKNNKSDDLLINFINNGHRQSEINEITVNQYGELSDWPDGFFDQEEDDLRELLLLKKEKKAEQ